MKAPYWFEKEGNSFRLYEKGRKTAKTYRSIDSAKKDVLAMNDAFRASKGKMALPRLKNGKRKPAHPHMAGEVGRPLTEREMDRFFKALAEEERDELQMRYMTPAELKRAKARSAKRSRMNPKRKK